MTSTRRVPVTTARVMMMTTMQFPMARTTMRKAMTPRETTIPRTMTRMTRKVASSGTDDDAPPLLKNAPSPPLPRHTLPLPSPSVRALLLRGKRKLGGRKPAVPSAAAASDDVCRHHPGVPAVVGFVSFSPSFVGHSSTPVRVDGSTERPPVNDISPLPLLPPLRVCGWACVNSFFVCVRVNLLLQERP
uniref:Uncharacterized protein n=1 Tax=Rhipicephalus pulchellus TaxID=72859 RepID=L7MBZ9_RHIPC